MVCDSCEVLKQELAISHQNYKELLTKLTAQPEVAEVKEPAIITQPRFISWKVRREMLEREDRIKAVAMKSAGKPKSTEELESELMEKEKS